MEPIKVNLAEIEEDNSPLMQHLLRRWKEKGLDEALNEIIEESRKKGRAVAGERED